MTTTIQRKSAATLLIALLCGASWADTYSTSPAEAWSQDGDTFVFNSSSSGTLDSTTATQSTSTTAGLSGAVSLEKKGSGTLTVNGVHSFTGNVDVREGTLAVGDGTHDKNDPRNSALCDPLAARKITVWTNGTLSVTKTDIFGNAKTSTADILADLEIRGGTLSTTDGTCTEFGNVLFYDATVNIGSNQARWPGFMVSGDWLEFGSSTATPFALSSTHGVRFGKRKPTEIRVPDITGDDASDVIFEAYINDEAKQDVSWDSPTNFVKTGAGTLELKNASSTFLRDAVISNGTLRLRAGSARIGNVASALGSTEIPHTIYIESGAKLDLAASNLLGQFYNNPTGVCIHVCGGTLSQTTNGLSNTFGPLILEDATLEYSTGAWDSTTQNRWPVFGFSDVTFKGSTAYTLSGSGNSFFAFGMNGMGDLCVEKIVSDGTYSAETPDVTISAPILDCLHTWSGNGPRATTFRKTGPGVLNLNSTVNAFTGDVEIDEGVVTLAQKKAGNGSAPIDGPLGNLMTNRTITVCGTGELYYGYNDQLCQACADMDAAFVVSNGTVRFKSGTINAWPTVKFYDANLVYGNGYGSSGNGDSSSWGLWVMRYPVTFDGTKTMSLPSNGDNCIISLGYSSDHSEETSGDLTYHHGRTEFCVKEMTGDANIDVDIGMDIQSLPYWSSGNNTTRPNDRYRCGLLKTGPGTLRLGGKFTCPETTRINAGALVFDGTLAEQQSGWGKSAMLVESGAYLGGTGTVENVTIEAGGGFTSALGHDGALKINGSVTLPQDGVVKVNIVCTEDTATLDAYTIPVVESAKLAGASFVPVFNGGEELPERLSMSIVERDGIVYGKISKKGLVIIFK